MHLSQGLTFFPQANGKRAEEGHCVIQIHVQFIVSIRRLEQFDQEQVVENNRYRRSNGRQLQVVLKAIRLHFPEQHPKSYYYSYWHNYPTNHRWRNNKEKNDPKQVADKPEGYSPTKRISPKLSAHANLYP
ncbi:MAG: hypothetical protein WCC58_11790 [Burkholderiales bacterium]